MTRLRVKKLSLRRRHPFGYCASDMRREIRLKKDIVRLIKYHSRIDLQHVERRALADLIEAHLRLLQDLQINPPELTFVVRGGRKYFLYKLTPIPRKNLRIHKLVENDVAVDFRFRSRDELHQLFNAFGFQEWYRYRDSKGKGGHKFHGEEVLLCGLYRLHMPVIFGDAAWRTFFGFSYSRASKCFQIFCQHMKDNWAYLLLDNINFWKPYLKDCARSIGMKLNELGLVDLDPERFGVFGFIDNTCNAACRPGGGPTRDGVNAPRNNPLIQRAFYNGWKKLHGTKWQTVDLPNGMIFHAWGPCSLRHNDLWTLNKSEITDLIRDADIDLAIYGDSAYIVKIGEHLKARHHYADITEIEIAENKHISSCREIIEWDYGGIKNTFKAVNFRFLLKLRRQPVTDMFLIAMILFNAKCCLHGNQTSTYFALPPPSLGQWVSQGPRPLSAEAAARLRIGPDPAQAYLPDMEVDENDLNAFDLEEFNNFEF